MTVFFAGRLCEAFVAVLLADACEVLLQGSIGDQHGPRAVGIQGTDVHFVVDHKSKALMGVMSGG